MNITKEDIAVRFDEYNGKYFGGVLAPCKYHIIREKWKVMGFYRPINKNGKRINHIWINRFVDWTEEDLREVIVHEMIHHYVQTIEGHLGGFFGHNWRFRRQCRRLRREFGLNIPVHSFHIYFTWETPPKNLYQKIRRII